MKKLLVAILILFSTFANSQVWYEIKPNGDTLFKWYSPVTTQIFIKDSVLKPFVAPYVPPVVTPPPTAINYLFNIGWEQADALKARDGYGYWPNSIENPGTGIKPEIVVDPTNASNRVLKIGVNSNNKDGSRIRSEMTAWNLTGGLRQKAFYSIKVFIPTDFKSDQNANNFIQFHNAGRANMIPNVAFMLKGKQLDLNIAWTTTATAPHSDIHRFFDVSNWFGRWVTISMEINWTPDATGYFKLFVDGVPFSNGKDFSGVYNGPMGYNGDSMGPYLKFGLHYPGGVLPSGSTATSQKVYYDDILIINSIVNK